MSNRRWRRPVMAPWRLSMAMLRLLLRRRSVVGIRRQRILRPAKRRLQGRAGRLLRPPRPPTVGGMKPQVGPREVRHLVLRQVPARGCGTRHQDMPRLELPHRVERHQDMRHQELGQRLVLAKTDGMRRQGLREVRKDIIWLPGEVSIIRLSKCYISLVSRFCKYIYLNMKTFFSDTDIGISNIKIRELHNI